MVSVGGLVTSKPLANTPAPTAVIQESDIATVISAIIRPKYRDFIDSLDFDYDLRLGLIAYGLDDQAQPRLHPFFDYSGSLKTRPGGRVWVFQGTILLDGTNSGQVSLTVSPAAKNSFEILSFRVEHDDGVSRNSRAEIRDDQGTPADLINLMRQSSSGLRCWPKTAATSDESSIGKHVLAGTMDLFIHTDALAVNKKGTFSLTCLIFGPDLPTITLAGPTGSTDTTNVNKVYE